ncbi:MAG: MBL fold metallo-hydrolase [Syntrophobacteraceae bacterium]
MALVREVADEIYEIFPENLKSGVVCLCYLVVGEQTALIETGSTSQVDEILKGIAKLGYGPESLSYIIPTHIHSDHGGGAGYLAGKARKAKVVVHPKGAPHMKDPSKLIAGSRQVYGDDFEGYFGPIIPVPEAQILQVEDNGILSLGERDLKIVHTPGHCANHIGIYDYRTKGFFCGEALGAYLPKEEKVILSVAPPLFMLDIALASMEKIKKLDLEYLFYSQWGHSDDPKALINQFHDNLNSCVEQVLDSLRAEDSDEAIDRKFSHYVDPDDTYIISKPLRELYKAFDFGIGPLVEYLKQSEALSNS